MLALTSPTPSGASMSDAPTTSPRDTVRPLLRTRQVREFTAEPLTEAELDAIVDAGRWSGSSQNQQPWRFIVIRDVAALRAFHDLGLPQTRSLKTATAAVAIVLPAQRERLVSDAYDDGRAAERMLIAANMLGLGGGIAWIRFDVLDAVRGILGLPDDLMVRTILALGHPTEAALRPKSKPGEARRPRNEAVFEERWPTD
jgi:nitroreductase